MSKSKTSYVAVNTIVYGDPMADADKNGKRPAPQRYNPGELFDADAGDTEIQRLLDKGAIKESKQAKAEADARAAAAAEAKAAEEAAEAEKAAAEAKAAAEVAKGKKK